MSQEFEARPGRQTDRIFYWPHLRKYCLPIAVLLVWAVSSTDSTGISTLVPTIGSTPRRYRWNRQGAKAQSSDVNVRLRRTGLTRDYFLDRR
jgi:hypothetical protein